MADNPERPDREGIPTREEELRIVPRWARMAFAARCARRVQPIFMHDWPDAPEEHVKAVDTAITLSERRPAAGSNFVDSVVVAGADKAASAARAWDTYAANAADAAAAARRTPRAGCAADAAHAAADNSTIDALNSAIDAVTSTFRPYANDKPRAAAIAAMRRDFDLLKAAAEAEHWTDDTPVPPEFFGPLWPHGEPEGWPEAGREPRIGERTFTIEFEAPPGVSDEEAAERIARVLRLLDRLNRAQGGTGIVVGEDDVSAFDKCIVAPLVPVGGPA